MNVLLGGGLVDLAVSTEEAYSAEGTAPGGGDAGERVSKLRGLLGGKTVPTVLDADEMHATTMRLDYMLGNRLYPPRPRSGSSRPKRHIAPSQAGGGGV